MPKKLYRIDPKKLISNCVKNSWAWSYQQKISGIQIQFLIFWKIWGRYIRPKPDDWINKNWMTEIIYWKYIFWSCSIVNVCHCKFTIEHEQKYFFNIFFHHPGFIYSIIRFQSYVPALNFPKNQKLDLNSGNFLLVGLSPGDVFTWCKNKKNMSF